MFVLLPSHLLILINMVLGVSAMILFISMSRKTFNGGKELYWVKGNYADPCDHFTLFIDSWKERWSSYLPGYYEVLTYPNGDTYTISNGNVLRSSFSEVRHGEREIGLNQYINHIENALSIRCAGDISGNRVILRRFFDPHSGRKHVESDMKSSGLQPICIQCDKQFSLSYTNLNALQEQFANPKESST